jgi:ribosomal protein S19
MSRSKWKGPFLDKSLIKNINKIKLKKIWSRTSTICSSLIDKSFLVHSGNKFRKIYINREKVGFKFGDFCYTRVMKKKLHTKKLKNKKKKK